MKNNILFVSAILSLLAFSACDEDSFSQVVEVDIPEHESKLVFNALVNSSDTTISVLLSSSQGILSDPLYSVFANGQVRLLKDGVLVENLSFDADNSLKFITNGVLELGQGLYRLEAEVDGYPAIAAEQEMPKPVEINKAIYEPRGAITPDGDRADEIQVTFTDPVGEENFYAIRAFYEGKYWDGIDTFYYENEIYLETFDQFARIGNEFQIILTDNAFDGESYTLSAYTYSTYFPTEGDGKIKAVLYSLSRDAYYYDLSLNQYYQANGNPFAEPVTVHENVENGHGIFALRQVTERVADVE
ncbi:MAG TPA: DUF4249 domain-containing protein [Saprospiraceae bacterium]|nr:DUF4249 domain-containing protein [Saprospiraceae bacterium]HMQ83392.1 DUF4249 domain-containing protein [Saprospiraceae bacterium]